jgi:hypothetical protein
MDAHKLFKVLVMGALLNQPILARTQYERGGREAAVHG